MMRLNWLLLGLVACGGTPVALTVVAADAGEPADASRDELPPFFQPPDEDAGEPPDAAPGVDACVPPPVAALAFVSRSCTILGDCPTCAGAMLVLCDEYIGPAQPGSWLKSKPFDPPPAPDCRQIGPQRFCCPRQGVRKANDDASKCNESATGMRAVAYPSGADKLPLVPVAEGCSFPAPLTSPELVMCCK